MLGVATVTRFLHHIVYEGVCNPLASVGEQPRRRFDTPLVRKTPLSPSRRDISGFHIRHGWSHREDGARSSLLQVTRVHTEYSDS